MASRTVVVRGPDGVVVCDDCPVARTPFSRMRGLLGKTGLRETEGLLFPRTRSIHTHFMRFPIDVVFLSDDGQVVRIVESLGPWRARSLRQARSVLELPGGRCAQVGLQVGDSLDIDEPRGVGLGV